MPDTSINSATAIISQFDPLNAHKSDFETYVAAYDFTARDGNQLSLKRGQPVRIKQKCDMNKNAEWWLAEDISKNSGYVPANYLTKQ